MRWIAAMIAGVGGMNLDYFVIKGICSICEAI